MWGRDRNFTVPPRGTIVIDARFQPDLNLDSRDGSAPRQAVIDAWSRRNVDYFKPTSVTDKSLTAYALRTDPFVLDLAGQAAITGDGLKRLAKGKGLVGLDLTGTQIGDDDLKHLAGMTSLRVLILTDTQ